MPSRALSFAFVVALWGTPAVAQDCFGDVTGTDVGAVLERAEAAYAEGDPRGFEASIQEMNAFVMPCVVAPVTPALAARLHRVEALRRFLADDKEGSRRALVAARWLDPKGTYGAALLPQGHELRATLEGVTPTAPEGRRLPPPKRGSIWFDGFETRLRPDDRPTLLQLTDADGRVVSSTYLAVGAPTPAYPLKPRIRTALAITSGVAAAVFTGLFANAFVVRDQYFGTDPGDDATLDRLRTTTNALAGASVGVGVVAVGTGVAAAVIGPR